MGLTIGQKVKVVEGLFAGTDGVIEAYDHEIQTFSIRIGEDAKSPEGDLGLRAIRISVPCEFVRFV